MSAKPRILVTRRLPENVTARVTRDYDAILNPEDRIYQPDELVKAADGCDGLLICPSERMTPELVAELPDSIRIVSTFSVGHEHLDVAALKARNITATNTPDVLNDAVAEIAILCLLGAARRAYEGEMLVRNDQWHGWHTGMLLGKHMTGGRLGIVGMGGIGREIADRARAFRMDIHYHNRSRLTADQEKGATYHDTLAGLLGVADFLVIACPSTPETRGMINAETLQMLPNGAVVVNIARGDIIQDDGMIAALKSGKVFAAGLDVFDGEPNIDPRYRDLENAFLLPHVGSATDLTRDAMGFCCLDNLDAFFAGKKCPTAL